MSDYNGWRNYPTWLTNQWLTNDEESNTYWEEQAREHDVQDLAEMLEDDLLNDVDEAIPGYGLLRDLINISCSKIDFLELAESFKSVVEENEDEHEDES